LQFLVAVFKLCNQLQRDSTSNVHTM